MPQMADADGSFPPRMADADGSFPYSQATI